MESILEIIKDKWSDGPGNSICSEHELTKEVKKEKTWEDPCPFCLLKARKVVFPEEFNNNDKHTPTYNEINLYLRFLTFPSPRLDFWFIIFNLVRNEKTDRDNKKDQITIEEDVFKSVKLALSSPEGWIKELGQPTDQTTESRAELSIMDLYKYRFNLIAEWFLHRYHLPAAFQFLRFSKNFNSEKQLSELLSFNWYNFTLFLFSVLILGGSIASLAIVGFGLSWLVMLILFVLISSISWLSVGLQNFIRLLLPKQFGAIMAGNLVLIFVGAEFWDAIYSFIEFLSFYYISWLLPLILLFAIYFYLFLETTGRIGYSLRRIEVHPRSLSIGLLGIIETVFIGNFIFAALAPFMGSFWVEHSNVFPKEYLNAPLCFSQIVQFLSMIFLALLVGIFLQVFWEDKPITVSL